MRSYGRTPASRARGCYRTDAFETPRTQSAPPCRMFNVLVNDVSEPPATTARRAGRTTPLEDVLEIPRHNCPLADHRLGSRGTGPLEMVVGDGKSSERERPQLVSLDADDSLRDRLDATLRSRSGDPEDDRDSAFRESSGPRHTGSLAGFANSGWNSRRWAGRGYRLNRVDCCSASPLQLLAPFSFASAIV
jgi:hypothetical protein